MILFIGATGHVASAYYNNSETRMSANWFLLQLILTTDIKQMDNAFNWRYLMTLRRINRNSRVCFKRMRE